MSEQSNTVAERLAEIERVYLDRNYDYVGRSDLRWLITTLKKTLESHAEQEIAARLDERLNHYHPGGSVAESERRDELTAQLIARRQSKESQSESTISDAAKGEWEC